MNETPRDIVYNKAINNGITTNQIIKIEEGIEIVGYAFNYNEWTDETLPVYIKDLFPYVTRVGDYAFYHSKLTKLNLPVVKSIEFAAFRRSKIKELNLPLVENIANCSFEGSKIVKLNIPLIINIGDWSFKSSKITMLNIPLVKSIGFYAFNNLKHWYFGTNSKILSIP